MEDLSRCTAKFCMYIVWLKLQVLGNLEGSVGLQYQIYHGYREYNYRKPSGLSLTIINPRARMRSERLLQLVGQSVGGGLKLYTAIILGVH